MIMIYLLDPIPKELQDLYDPLTGRMIVVPSGNKTVPPGKKLLVIPNLEPMGKFSNLHLTNFLQA